MTNKMHKKGVKIDAIKNHVIRFIGGRTRVEKMIRSPVYSPRHELTKTIPEINRFREGRTGVELHIYPV